MNLERFNLSENSYLLFGTLPDSIIVNVDHIYNLKPITRDTYTTLGIKYNIPRYQKAFLNDYNFPGINVQGENVLSPELTNIFNYANDLPKDLLGMNENEKLVSPINCNYGDVKIVYEQTDFIALLESKFNINMFKLIENKSLATFYDDFNKIDFKTADVQYNVSFGLT